jgi:SAM-dependent methyltransferase
VHRFQLSQEGNPPAGPGSRLEQPEKRMIEDEGAQQVVDFYGAILRSRGRTLSAESMILDFGCGTGRHTYEYLEAGFPNTFGYDVRNYVRLRAAADAARFRFDAAPKNPDSYPSMSAIPWPNESFDFVFATSVFEHVADQELACREIHRVLKYGGMFLNVFPSKWRPLEVHTNIPFGSVIASSRYLALCAALGIRGAGQQNFTRAEVIKSNRLLLTRGVNYLSGGEIASLLPRIFGEFDYVEDAFIRHSPGRSRYLEIPLKALPVLRKLYRFAHTRAILSTKTRPQRVG